MIDPAQTVTKTPGPQDTPPRNEREARAAEAPGDRSEARLAEREKQVTPPAPVFDVRLDGETMRLVSELRDPETNRVLMRLPAGYQPERDEPQNGVSTEA